MPDWQHGAAHDAADYEPAWNAPQARQLVPRAWLLQRDGRAKVAAAGLARPLVIRQQTHVLMMVTAVAVGQAPLLAER
jgi:hypothetical protein